MALLSFLLATAIWQCTSPAGTVTFTDQPCADKQTERKVVTRSLITLPALHNQSWQRADAIGQRAQQQLRARVRNKSRQRSALERSRHQREKICRAARSDLERIQAKRRKGYRLSDEAKLDADEGNLDQQIREHC